MFLESQLFIYESNTTVGERDIDEEKLSVSKLPNPIAKEFIFRVSLPRPNSYSREVPQRMYCALSAGEFRVAGAFSEDITYF
jgi:Rab3 GTPase-activating protein catalytic subunit